MFFSWWVIHVAHVKIEFKVKHWTLLEKAFAWLFSHVFPCTFFFSSFCCGEYFFSGNCPSSPFPPPSPLLLPPKNNYDPPVILLTILAEVIHNNNSTQQFRWRSVDDTVYSAKKDRQPLLVEADYDSGSWQLGWIRVMFGFTTVWIRFTMSKENTHETQCAVLENIYNPPT